MTTMLGAASVLLTSCVNGVAIDDDASASSRDMKVLDRYVEGVIDEGSLPFLYVRLERADGSVIYEQSAVNRKLIPDLQVSGESWMRIWSMSKLVTIVTVLDLVEDGILDLSDPVVDYLPELADLKVAVGADFGLLTDRPADGEGNDKCPYKRDTPKTVMTIEHLMDHKAGFYYATTNIPCLDDLVTAAELPNAVDTDDFLNRISAIPLIQDPGSVYYYGTNTTILGMVAERSTGKPLADLVEERITGPLGIKGLAYRLPEGAVLPPRIDGGDGVLRFAEEGELDIFGGAVPSYDDGQGLFLGGEGMTGNAVGYLKFIRMLLGRGELNGVRILDETSIEELIKPRTELDNPYGYNGYNLWISNGYRGENRPRTPGGLWVGGGYEGTRFWIDPDREIVGVLLTQIHETPYRDTDPFGDLQILLYETLFEKE